MTTRTCSRVEIAFAASLLGLFGCGSDKDSGTPDGDADTDTDSDSDSDADSDTDVPFDTGPFSKPETPGFTGSFDNSGTPLQFAATEGSWLVVGPQTYITGELGAQSISLVIQGDATLCGVYGVVSATYVAGQNNTASGPGGDATFEVTAHDESGEYMWGSFSGTTLLTGKQFPRLILEEAEVVSWPKP